MSSLLVKATILAEKIADKSGVHPKDRTAYIQILVNSHFKKITPYQTDKKGFPVLKRGRIQFLPRRELHKLNRLIA